MKRYLFFLRHYNDIDNIAPAIFFFLRESNQHRADVVIYNGTYDFRCNPNLKFLQETFGTRFSYTWLGYYFNLDLEASLSKSPPNITPPGKWERVKSLIKRIDRLCQRSLKVSPLSSIRRLRDLSDHALKFIRRETDSPEPFPLTLLHICLGQIQQAKIKVGIEKVLAKNGFPALVIFDINRTFEIAGLLTALRSCGVPRIIGLPVSPLINYNVLREESFVDVHSQYFKNQHDYSGLDQIAYVDEYFLCSYNQLFEVLGISSSLKGKTVTLGSLRYCPDWLSIREKIVPIYERKSERIKIVFFPSHSKSNANWDEYKRSLELISLFPEYEVVVKYHTRYFSSLQDQNKKNIHFETHADSSSLINWADIVIFWSSSIAIEGYLKQKTMICLSYIVGNKNLYVDFDAGYIAKCRDDLFFFLSIYRKTRNKLKLNYNVEGAKNLMRNVIVPNGKATPKAYLDFMKENEFHTV